MTQTGWVPLALSRNIAPGTSAGTALAGAEIVVWRDSAGTPHTWEDRCPHRGMKMSFGFVRGDHIACLYHGWEYDETGTCRYIPAHPELEVPKSICVTRYGVAEAAGMIWVHHPFGAPAADKPEAAEVTGIRSLYLDVPLETAIAGLGAGFAGEASMDGPVAVVATPELTLRIGLHSIAEARCALHLTAEGQPSEAALLGVLSRAKAFRARCESLPSLKEAAA